jgi:dephospho-CoA kinase
MAEHVFGEHAAPGARERLDAIEHPLIYEAARRIERSAVPGNDSVADNGTSPESLAIVVHDVPLLTEVIGSMPFAFAHIVSIEAPEETRVARMIGTRGMSREQALARIRHQSSEAERRALADEVIDATQPIERMFERVDTLVAQWRSELRDSPYR